jgi:hypothetical protein
VTVAKYRKKPVEVEAEQFVIEPSPPDQPLGMFMLWPVLKDDHGIFLVIPTPEGLMRANLGDWIIKGVKGEYYPCKPDIFEATYEPVW